MSVLRRRRWKSERERERWREARMLGGSVTWGNDGPSEGEDVFGFPHTFFGSTPLSIGLRLTYFVSWSQRFSAISEAVGSLLSEFRLLIIVWGYGVIKIALFWQNFSIKFNSDSQNVLQALWKEHGANEWELDFLRNRYDNIRSEKVSLFLIFLTLLNELWNLRTSAWNPAKKSLGRYSANCPVLTIVLWYGVIRKTQIATEKDEKWTH